MNAQLQQEFQLLESKKQALLAELDLLEENILTAQPADHAWSVLQIISHLEKIEAGTLAYIEKKLSYNPPLKKSNFLTRLRAFAQNFALKLPLIRFKAPKALKAENKGEDFFTIKEKWLNTRLKMEAMFEPMSEELLHAEFFNSPNVGYIKILDQVNFINLHFDRHRNQIDRTLKLVMK